MQSCSSETVVENDQGLWKIFWQKTSEVDTTHAIQSQGSILCIPKVETNETWRLPNQHFSVGLIEQM